MEKKFRELVMEAHSDHGGKDGDVAELVAARDLLRDTARTDLVPMDDRHGVVTTRPSGELVALERERDARETAERKSEQVTKNLVRAELTRIETAHRRANLLAWIGGGGAAILVALRSTSVLEVELWEGPFSVIVVALLILGGACWTAGFLIKGQITTEEQAIRDAAEAMNDRSTFLDLFLEIIAESDDPDASGWTASELKEAIQNWSVRRSKMRTWRLVRRGRIYQKNALKRAASRIIWSVRSISGQLDSNPTIAELALLIGSAGFYRLLIAKGAETMLLRANESVEGDRIRIDYRLVVEASAVETDPV